MTSLDTIYLLFFLICLILSAFFASSEIAFINLQQIRLRHLQESGVRGADRVARIMEHPERFLSVVLTSVSFNMREYSLSNSSSPSIFILAGEVAAASAREGDTSERRLSEYEDRWRGTIGKTIFSHIEANRLFMEIVKSDELIERAVAELGEHFAGLVIFPRLHLEPVKEWLREILA